VGACSHTAKPSTTTSSTPEQSSSQADNGAVDTDPSLLSLKTIVRKNVRIYNLAKAGQWVEVTAQFTALKQSVQQLNSTLASKSANLAVFNAQMPVLEKSIAAKDQQATMRESNQLILESIDLMKPLHPHTPVETILLGYYGRKLELDAIARNPRELQITASDVEKTWQTLRPQVQSKGDAQQIAQGDQLIAQLNQAKSATDYQQVAPALTRESRVLERLLQ
jgi:hypothetical protein